VHLCHRHQTIVLSANEPLWAPGYLAKGLYSLDAYFTVVYTLGVSIRTGRGRAGAARRPQMGDVNDGKIRDHQTTHSRSMCMASCGRITSADQDMTV
jgi:hypothetical protein